MIRYEILIEDINPCGGPRHARRSIIEAEIETPESYVREHGRFPVLGTSETPDGDIVISTGNGSGYMVRYTFSKQDP